MKSILLIGNFGYKTGHRDGQTIKTRNIYTLLTKHNNKINYFDTSFLDSIPQIIKLFFYIIQHKIIIIIPADGFLEKIFPPLYYLCKITRNEIIHLGVGGWQIEFFEGKEGKFCKHSRQLFLCKKIKAFCLEIKNIEIELKNKYNFTNTFVFPNFRISDFTPSNKTMNIGLKLVYMGRINSMKGCDMILYVMKKIESLNLNIKLDFYGPIEKEYEVQFTNTVLQLNNVKYEGILNDELIYKQLEKYDILLLPTKYYTEGFPGAILDAYMSGVPVIATNWKHSHEFIKNNITGFIIPFINPEKFFIDKILFLYNNPDILLNMKLNAYNESLNYTEDKAWSIISKLL